jgi:dipeptidase
MVLALGSATADGQTVFGFNTDHRPPLDQLLTVVPGREHAAGEAVHTQSLEISEARQTYRVIGSKPVGWWGFSHGVNEHAVVAGGTVVRSLLSSSEPGLTGGDLVRLALERSRTARQAVDCLCTLVERHGQSAGPNAKGPGGSVHTFLIADPSEGFAVETAGRHWVYQENQELRAAGNAAVIRQDWDRISRGLAGSAITNGWWPGDGSKLDFAITLSQDPMGQASGMRRWGRATYLLEQQNGHIDAGFLRRVLSDHYEGTHFEVNPAAPIEGPVPICQHGFSGTAASLIAQLSADSMHLPICWWAFGPPCLSVYFPVFLEGELPPALLTFGGRLASIANDIELPRRHPHSAHDGFDSLQARLDREAEEFSLEGAALKRAGDGPKLDYLATAFMQQAIERFEIVLDEAQPAHATGSRPGLLRDAVS